MIKKIIIYVLLVLAFAVSAFLFMDKVFAQAPPPATVMWMFYHPAGPSIQSKKVTVTVTWKEGDQNKTVKLYDVLRSAGN